jgi:3-hydroxy-9,10-secoandrosta-1,3,5(10)-triene-9,17-dione monooxygenase reductase component
MTTSPPSPSAKRHRSTDEDARSFRDALGAFATGVAFVAAAPGGEPAGLIVNSLTSVSLDPPLVSFCPSRTSLTWSRMRRAERLGISILGSRHEAFARRAAPAGVDRFAGTDWAVRRGAPLLSHALAWLECEIVAEHRAGDHWIVVARVDRLRLFATDDPLVFFAGAYRGLAVEERAR